MKVLAALVAVVPLTALAEGPSRAAASPGPADPAAAVPEARYVSPFVRYRRLDAGGVAPWRDLNDEVARIGGWKAYAREVYEANEAAKAAGRGEGAPRDKEAGSR